MNNRLSLRVSQATICLSFFSHSAATLLALYHVEVIITLYHWRLLISLLSLLRMFIRHWLSLFDRLFISRERCIVAVLRSTRSLLYWHRIAMSRCLSLSVL